jgi:hypothetical protein
VPAYAGHPSAIEINRYLIGEGITNRRLLGRKVGWDWKKEFEFLSEFKEKLGEEISKLAPEGREQNEKNLRCLMMSKFLNDVRTFFQENS